MQADGIVDSLLGYGGAAESALIYGDRSEILSEGATYGVAGVARLATGIPYGSDLRVTEEDQRSPDFADYGLSGREDSSLLSYGHKGRPHRRHIVRFCKSSESYHVYLQSQPWKNPLLNPDTKTAPVVKISENYLAEIPEWPTIKRSSTLWIDRSNPLIEAYESQWASNSQKAWNTQRAYDLQRATLTRPPPAYISLFCRSERASSGGHTITKKKSKRDIVESHRPFKYFRITNIVPISLAWEAMFWLGFLTVVIATPVLWVTLFKVPPQNLNPYQEPKNLISQAWCTTDNVCHTAPAPT